MCLFQRGWSRQCTTAPTRGNQIPQLQDGYGGQILTPWFEDETVAKTAAEPMHGLRLIIKEDVLPISDYPKFEAIAEVAKRGLLRIFWADIDQFGAR